MAHAGDEEEAVEVGNGDVVRGKSVEDLRMVVDGGLSRDRTVSETVVVQEFAAARIEGGDVEVVGSRVTGVDGFGKSDESRAVPVCFPVPGIAETEHVLDIIKAETRGLVFAHQADGGVPLPFTANLETGEDQASVCFVPARVPLLESDELVVGEAFGGVGCRALAEESLRAELAAEGVLDDVIDDTVLTVALAKSFSANDAVELVGDMVRLVRGQIDLSDPAVPELEMVGPPRRGTSDNAVEVLREQLDFAQTLTTAGTAAAVVTVGDGAVVVRFGDLLAVHDGLVERAVAPVDLLLGLVVRPAADGGRAVVAQIAGENGEAIAKTVTLMSLVLK